MLTTRIQKATAAATVGAGSLVLLASPASATPVPPDASTSAPAWFDMGADELLETFTGLGPWIIGVGLTVTIGSLIISKFSRGRTPRKVIG